MANDSYNDNSIKMPNQISVTQLFIYPVKSLAGIALEQSDIDSMGLKYDRRWMVVSPEGQFITQRTVPKMALIATDITNGRLTLSTSNKDKHEVALTTTQSEQMDVVVWKDSLRVSRVGDAVDEWLSDVLGIACHLVYIEDHVVRQCDLAFSDEGERTGFADGFPILIVSEESLNDLNQKLDTPVDMRRFRPNIVISGVEPFAEDQLTQFSIGDIPMKGVKVCSRCPLTMNDPDLGERTSQEPIATLSTYRKWDGNIFFGMNVIQQKQGRIKRGDVLKA